MNPAQYYSDYNAYQPPIKNDKDSQALSSLEDFDDSARNQPPPQKNNPQFSNPYAQAQYATNNISQRGINGPLNQQIPSQQQQRTQPQRDQVNHQPNRQQEDQIYSFDQNARSSQPQGSFQQQSLNRRSNQTGQERPNGNQWNQNPSKASRGIDDTNQYEARQQITTEFIESYPPDATLPNSHLDHTYSEHLIPQADKRSDLNVKPNRQNGQGNGKPVLTLNTRQGQEDPRMMMESQEQGQDDPQREEAAKQFNSISQYMNDSSYGHVGKVGQNHVQKLNYSGMYAYQNENLKNNQDNMNGSAHLAYENPTTTQHNEMYDQPSMINNGKLTPLEITYIKEAQKILDREFFYNKIPVNYHSFLVPLEKRPATRRFFMEFFFPIIIVFGIHIFLWGIQKKINDYCFYGFTGCECATFGTALWTFFKQMLSWKLGVIACKKILLQSIIQEQNPILECFMIYFVGIGIDFAMVAGIGLRIDWHFYLAIFVIGFVITLHSVKFHQLVTIWKNGRGIYSYDINLALLMIFAYFALPSIYSSLIDRHGFSYGRNAFFYLYPLIEWVMELCTYYVLQHASQASFFQYQLQLFLLGLRVGIMTSTSSSNFEFWYLGVIFLIKRILESTNIHYLLIRKGIYEMFPKNIRHYVSMGEIPDYRKGTEGFYLENILWIGFYFWWWGTETLVPGSVKGEYIVISDCQFGATGLFSNVSWERPFFTWIFLSIGQLIGLLVNSNLRYDMIKWVGVPQHNWFENIFTRMFGWYLFQVALAICYAFSREELSTYTNF